VKRDIPRSRGVGEVNEKYGSGTAEILLSPYIDKVVR